MKRSRLVCEVMRPYKTLKTAPIFVPKRLENEGLALLVIALKYNVK